MAVPASPLLSLGITASKIPGALAAGKLAGEQQLDRQEARMQRRADAKHRKEVGEFQLKRLGREDVLAEETQDVRVQEMQQQLQGQEQQMRLQGQKSFREDTYRALDGILKDGSYKQFNLFLQDATENPYAPGVMKDTLRVDPISTESETDRQALNAAGIDNTVLDELDGTKDGQIDWDLVKRRYVLATGVNGKKEIRDIYRLGVVTGYADWTDAQGRAKMTELANISKKTAGRGPSAFSEKVSAEESYQLAIKEDRTPTAAEVAGHQLFKSETGGDKTVRAEGIELARQEWRDNKFSDMTQEELQANPDARRIVNQIEENHPLSKEEKKELRGLNSMIALSSEAGQLSDEQTGVFDKLVSGASSYVNDKVGDKTAKAAYGAFINQFRHELFGSALTTGELKSFKEAYGALGQKTGPVLAGLRAALIQVKSKLTTMANTNDPMVMQFRTGKSQAEVKASLAGLDQRIKFYDLVAGGVKPDEAARLARGEQTNSQADIDAAVAGLGL